MSNNAFPSMTALLGLLAIAGYQNRDKLAELLGGRGQVGSGAAQPAGVPNAPAGGLGGLLGGLMGQGGIAQSGPGGFLGAGLRELVDRFSQNGQGDVTNSWVGTGPNKDISPARLESALGPDVLQALTQKTGLSREEILSRLSRELPSAVDRYTPDGQLPR
jgi:uncharacterized protein YidB (DUF937 family)